MAGKNTVAVCSLAQSDTEYKYLISVLKEQCGVCVKYVHISSKLLENGHDFSQYDGVILIHSIYWGRMSLTDVRDARYQKLFLHWKNLLGRDRVAVIVTGAERTTDLEVRFKEKQPTVSECSTHVLFCESGDPMNDDHVASTMKSFVGLLPDRPKVRKVQAKPSEATTELSEDNSNKETMTIQAKKEKCAGIDVKNGEDKVHVEVIICAEGSTKKTLLKTLSEDDLKDEVDFLIFQEKVDDWELLEARSITSFDPSSELIHCAVFIYRNEVSPNFTDGDFKEFEEIINGRTSPTDIEVSGKADKYCLLQLQQVFLECINIAHIVTVSPGDVHMASSLSRNQTQREWEHQHEATLKKEAMGRIQKLHREIRTLRQELSCKEKKLATYKDNISEKHCEQNNIQSEINGKNKKLQSLTEDIEKAQQKLDETRKEFHTEEKVLWKVRNELNEIEKNREQESTRFQKAEKEVNQSEKKIEELITKLEACTTALRNAGHELNQIKDKIEEMLKELQAFANESIETEMEVNETENKIEEIFAESQANVPMEVSQTKTNTDEELQKCEACATVRMKAAMEADQSKKEIEELSKRLQVSSNARMQAEMEVIKTKKKIEELLNESQAFKHALRKTEEELNQTKTKTEEVLTKFRTFATALTNAKKEHQQKAGCQIS